MGGEEFTGGANRSVRALRIPLAHERQGAVGERREVAGAAEGAELVDDRGDSGVQDVGHGLRDGRADACAAGADGLEPQEHQGADDLALDVRAHTGGVRPHDVALQLGAQFRADVPGREGSEAGGDPVHGLRLGRQRFHDLAGRGERRDRFVGELDPGAAARHGENVGRGDTRRPHHHSVHIHIQERTQ